MSGGRQESAIIAEIGAGFLRRSKRTVCVHVPQTGPGRFPLLFSWNRFPAGIDFHDRLPAKVPIEMEGCVSCKKDTLDFDGRMKGGFSCRPRSIDVFCRVRLVDKAKERRENLAGTEAPDRLAD